jgi:OFA family oxalate/formate antiporter-like MFS transporter
VAGGSASWGRIVAGAVLLDLVLGPLFVWGVIAPALGRELRVTGIGLALVFSTGLATFTLGVLAGGRAADTAAPGRLALLTAFGAVVGLLTAAAANTLWTLGLGLAVLGGAAGLGYATALQAAGTVATRRGLALGLVVSAYAGGTVAMAPLTGALLQVVGQRGTLVALAGLVAGCGLGAALLLPWARPHRGDPSRERQSPPSPRPRGAGWLWLTFALGSAPALGAFAHAGVIAGGSDRAAAAVALLSAGNLGGRLIAGPLSDRIGPSASLHGDIALLTVACPVLAFLGGTTSLAGLLLLGVQYGALSALVPAATAGIVPAHRYGRTYGLVFTGWGLAGLVAPIAMAWLGAWGGVRLSFVVALGVALLTWLCVAAFTAQGRR